MLSISKVDSRSFSLCCYVNRTDQIQIVRISNIDEWYFEKVIFPQQRLLFDALPEAELEVYSKNSSETTRISCEGLLVD
ncbi:protein of unknown function (DUF1830) [Xenococcus sp. PCC 7305]|uniref:DUF1830 domain-containing protein n=1 Tax=Xenococcus sp. PCC 7305 TaxID=102125 RepID=UPI0002ABDDDE|nr:DUF1830 domain-containing protein [Xenococcus sp. PCC 7305]ELS02223.1 protein of unknown function (DUF1830) [Xenococcus sp. PCC 7305]